MWYFDISCIIQEKEEELKLTNDDKKRAELKEKLKEVTEQYNKDKSLWEKRITDAEEKLKLLQSRKKKHDGMDCACAIDYMCVLCCSNELWEYCTCQSQNIDISVKGLLFHAKINLRDYATYIYTEQDKLLQYIPLHLTVLYTGMS